MKAKRTIGKILYNLIGKHLPMSTGWNGSGARMFRQFCAKLILENRCGNWVNIEHGAWFGDGLTIGNGSGIGANSSIPSEVVIGENVMMGRDVLMYTRNHRTDRLDIPMGAAGDTEPKPIVIGNDVWIGARVIILPGVNVSNGAVIGAGSIVTKDIPPYEIWAGNPAKKIRSRLNREISEAES